VRQHLLTCVLDFLCDAQETRQQDVRLTNGMLRPFAQDDIPEDYRLLTGKEFLENRAACTRVMSDWAICLLTDGKCDGRGYGSKYTPLSRQQREKSSSDNERMGEMLIGLDKGGPDLQTFYSDTLTRYKDEAARLDTSQLVDTFLQYNKGSYKPFVLVSSCPSDTHGGVHSRVKSFCESQRWRFAPVHFEDRNKARDWKRLWKLQVEDFACRVVADGKMTMLEVKIDGGGAGCAAERSKNMSQWWVDWIKRLGADVFDDLNGRSQASPIAPPGCVFIQIGQVLFTVYLPAVFPLQCMLQVAVCLRRYHGRCNSALGQQY